MATNNVQTLTIDGVTRQIEDVGARQLIVSLQSALNSLMSGDTTTAIESFNEVIDFLEGVTDQETLIGKLNLLNTAISGKVDVVPGKGLSTNDFTTALLNKLNGIATGAQVNVINGIQTHDGQSLTPNDGVVTLPESGGGDVTGVKVNSTTTVEPDGNGIVDISEAMAGKQNTINDLATIRTNSAKGVANVSTPATPDGTAVITLANGDTFTLNLNHTHSQYLKYVVCADEAAYNAIANKDSSTIYLTKESSNA